MRGENEIEKEKKSVVEIRCDPWSRNDRAGQGKAKKKRKEKKPKRMNERAEKYMDLGDPQGSMSCGVSVSSIDVQNRTNG